jgi:hypothetical protein
MNITYDFFSFNMWEWSLHSSVLERTKSNLLKINYFCGVILLHSNSFGALGQVFIMSHSYQTLILIVGCVTMRFALVDIRARLQNKVISFCYFHFFSVPSSFSVFASFIFLFCVCGIQGKKKGYIYLVNVSNHTSNILRKRERERKRLDRIWRMI